MRVIEIAAFLSLSGALHVAALTLSPTQGGGSGGGDAGQSDVTLQAATPTLAAMVADWDRPPDVSDTPSLVQPTVQPALTRPTTEVAIAPMQALSALAAPTPAPDRPQAEIRLPAPLTPLAETAAPTLIGPAAPQVAPLRMSPNGSRPARPSPINQPIAPQNAALPQVDTELPVSRHAPLTSARPALRPDRPKPGAAPTPRTPQSAARPAKKARGSGAQTSTTQAPKRKKPAAVGPSKSQIANAQQQWGAKITAAIRRAQRTPSGTNARGTTKLRIAVTPSGQLASLSIIASSGNARLDQAAVRAAKRARLPRAPRILTASAYRFNQSIRFSNR